MSRLLDKVLKEMRDTLEESIDFLPKVWTFQKLVDEEYSELSRAVGIALREVSFSQQLKLVDELDTRIWELRVATGTTADIKMVVWLALHLYFEKQLMSEFDLPRRGWVWPDIRDR